MAVVPEVVLAAALAADLEVVLAAVVAPAEDPAVVPEAVVVLSTPAPLICKITSSVIPFNLASI